MPIAPWSWRGWWAAFNSLSMNSVIIEANSPYSNKHQATLESYVRKRIELIACFGPYSEEWEEAMDWACVELNISGDVPGAFCNTTSHGTVPVAEVLQFVQQWFELKNQTASVEFFSI